MINKRAQALVEYVVLLSVVALGFAASADMLETAVKALFKVIGEFFSGVGP